MIFALDRSNNVMMVSRGSDKDINVSIFVPERIVVAFGDSFGFVCMI